MEGEDVPAEDVDILPVLVSQPPHAVKQEQRIKTEDEQGWLVNVKCKLCDYTVLAKNGNPIALVNHMRQTEDDIHHSIQCSICPKRFAYDYDLKKHQFDVHSDELGDAAPKFFNSKLLETIHCAECDIHFASKAALNHHAKTVHDPAGRKPKKRRAPKARLAELGHFPCSLCVQVLNSEAKLKQHLLFVHDDEALRAEAAAAGVRHEPAKAPPAYADAKDKFFCACGKIFWKKVRLATHIKRQNRSIDLFGCKYCGLKYTEKSSCVKHMRKYHTNEPDVAAAPKFECSFCAREFASQAGRSKHVTQLHRNEAGAAKHFKFKCYHCDMRFGSEVGWKKHMSREHAGEEKESSEEGSESGSGEEEEEEGESNPESRGSTPTATLNASRPAVSADDASNPANNAVVDQKDSKFFVLAKNFACERCGNRFLTDKGLRTHMAVRCGSGLTLKCKICDAAFSHSSILRNHIRLKHVGVTVDRKQVLQFATVEQNEEYMKIPFGCNFCPQRFMKAKNLELHCYKQHSERKSEFHFKKARLTAREVSICAVCGKKFQGSYRLMKRHIKFEHRTTPIRRQQPKIKHEEGNKDAHPNLAFQAMPSTAVERKRRLKRTKPKPLLPRRNGRLKRPKSSGKLEKTRLKVSVKKSVTTPKRSSTKRERVSPKEADAFLDEALTSFFGQPPSFKQSQRGRGIRAKAVYSPTEHEPQPHKRTRRSNGKAAKRVIAALEEQMLAGDNVAQSASKNKRKAGRRDKVFGTYFDPDLQSSTSGLGQALEEGEMGISAADILESNAEEVQIKVEPCDDYA